MNGFPRRVFLKRSAWSLAALSTAGAAGWTGCTPGETPGEGLQILSPREYAILRAVAGRFVPSGGPYDLGAEEVGVALKLDRFLASADPEIASNFRAGLWLLELGAPIFGPGWSRFTARDAAGQDACLRGLLAGRPRITLDLYDGFKRASLFAFYDDDAVWPHLGYDGPWVGRGAGTNAGDSP
ncbi:MAG: hypothetical protein KC466_05715 [Myxococcales bacterium]|nr:hypothetical protein [Myxococcales bacterium]